MCRVGIVLKNSLDSRDAVKKVRVLDDAVGPLLWIKGFMFVGFVLVALKNVHTLWL